MSEQNKEPIHVNYDRAFIDSALNMTLNFVEETLKGENKVIDLKLPAALAKHIDFTIQDQPCEQEKLIKVCHEILNNQAKPYHPHFHNALFGGFDQYSLIGAMMAPCINGTVYTYELSSCWTLMEDIFYERLRQIIGWETVDGTMTPGGSFANFMGLLLSRHQVLPQCRLKGQYSNKILKIFTSDVSHYSIKKGVILCGLGIENIVQIKSDENGRMIPEELQKAIEEQIANDCLPMMVWATAGTTVEGNIDPITEIGQICKKKKIWLHVDACYGGAFLMSPTLVKKLGNLSNVDSLSWDPHKALVVPLQATFFVTKHKGEMKDCNETKAECLFHTERASYNGCLLDVGDKSLQCGRVIDILKVWTYFKGNGWQNVAKQVEAEHSFAVYCKQYVLDHPQDFQLAIQEADTFNVCFWYIPKQMKKDQFETVNDFYNFLSTVTVYAKKFMIEEGKVLVGYSKSTGPYYFWRPCFSNPFIQNKDVDLILQYISKYTEQAYEALIKDNK